MSAEDARPPLTEPAAGPHDNLSVASDATTAEAETLGLALSGGECAPPVLAWRGHRLHRNGVSPAGALRDLRIRRLDCECRAGACAQSGQLLDS